MKKKIRNIEKSLERREEQLRLYRLQKRLENGEVIPETELTEATEGTESPVNDVVTPNEEVKETAPTEEVAPTEEAKPQVNKYAYLRNARRGKAGKESKVPSFKELNKDNNNVEEETLTPSSPIAEPTTEESAPLEPSIDKYAYLRNLSKGRKGGKENKVPSFKELQALNEENKAKLEEETAQEEVIPTIEEPINKEETDATPSEESSTNDKFNLLRKARRNKGKETRVPSFKELEAMKKKESEEVPPQVEDIPTNEEVPPVEEVLPQVNEDSETKLDIPQEETPINEVEDTSSRNLFEEPTSEVTENNEELPQAENNEATSNEKSNEHIPSFKDINKRNESDGVLATYNSETKTIPNIDASTRKNARFAFLRKSSKGRQGKETKVPSFKDLNK